MLNKPRRFCVEPLLTRTLLIVTTDNIDDIDRLKLQRCDAFMKSVICSLNKNKDNIIIIITEEYVTCYLHFVVPISQYVSAKLSDLCDL